ncbi:class D sortase [Paenibacillus sp. y28]|uniref:class D sortase n=1 Tax=Paenibacillus sp. y28 TaxID=3129110 RepID=UPI003018C60D
MLKKLLSLVCIAARIVIVLYPTVKDRYEMYEQQQILAQWEHDLQRLNDIAPEPEATADIRLPLAVETGAPAAAEEEKPAEPQPQDSRLKNVEGVLKIDKINLNLPILTDATVKNLQLSVASIANTGKPGEIGNYAIAGHRNLTYGKNFNRLDELSVGDVIEVDTKTRQYRYQVEEKQYVLPEEVWVLEGNGKDRNIVLVTCHPIDTGTHRLIVKGKLLENKG